MQLDTCWRTEVKFVRGVEFCIQFWATQVWEKDRVTEKPDEWPLRCWRDWSTSPVRRGWESWNCSAWRRGSGEFNRCDKYLKGVCRDDGSRLFSEGLSDKARGNGHRMRYRAVPLNIRKRFFSSIRVTEYSCRLPMEVMKSSSLRILQSCLYIILSILGFG